MRHEKSTLRREPVPLRLPEDPSARLALLSRLFALADEISENGPGADGARAEMRAILTLFSSMTRT